MKPAERNAFGLAVLGLGVSGLGWFVAPQLFPHACLAAFMGYLACALGSLGLLLIHALTGGRWGELIRPQLGALIAPLLWYVLLLIPVLLSGPRLYPWMDPHIAAHLHNTRYLNAPFFYVRTVIYAVVWLGLTVLVQRALRAAQTERHLARLAPVGLILLVLTMTFAWIDYTLSLEPEFQSSVYGWLAICEALLLALSVALLGTGLKAGREAASLARLLLGLTLLWAYLDFMQLLIVWNSDLPAEAAWYRGRLTGFWGDLAVAITVGHFALPFAVLLFGPLQRSARAIAGVAALLVLIELPRMWWLIIPAAHRRLSWVDAAAMLGMGGLSAGLALRAFARQMTRGASVHA